MLESIPHIASLRRLTGSGASWHDGAIQTGGQNGRGEGRFALETSTNPSSGRACGCCRFPPKRSVRARHRGNHQEQHGICTHDQLGARRSRDAASNSKGVGSRTGDQSWLDKSGRRSISPRGAGSNQRRSRVLPRVCRRFREVRREHRGRSRSVPMNRLTGSGVFPSSHGRGGG
jgi:hypothetical protein